MRRKIVAGNWKMNKTFQEADELINEIIEGLEEANNKNVNVVLCPPFTFMEMTTDYSHESDYAVGAQNVSCFDNGAYTGEVSAKMLHSMGVEYCIIGHSERRKYFTESDIELTQKAELLLKNDILPIFCCGELLPEREAVKHFDIVKQQLENALFGLDPLDFAKIIVAYEPVWAIGTGLTATSEQAQEMHAYIRSLISEKYGKEIAKNTSILYGGSCNALNAKELFANPDVDGGLIGGASLKAEDFLKIIDSF
ncbi:MAG: triose-phosphate isomerase [Bacteroidales bacterium]